MPLDKKHRSNRHDAGEDKSKWLQLVAKPVEDENISETNCNRRHNNNQK